MKKKNHHKEEIRGFTLVELLVAIALFSIVVAIAVGGFAGALRTQRQITSLLGAHSNISLAIEQISREIRTGSGFCPAGGGVSSCACTGTDPTTGASICETLSFTNAEGQSVAYAVQGGALEKSVDGGATYEPITASNVTISYFTVFLFGNAPGDHWNPRITIDLGVAPKDPTLASQLLSLQTTVSARAIDCDASGNC